MLAVVLVSIVFLRVDLATKVPTGLAAFNAAQKDNLKDLPPAAPIIHTEMSIPSSLVSSEDTYLCRSMAVPGSSEAKAIFTFEPIANEEVHHMIVFGCSSDPTGKEAGVRKFIDTGKGDEPDDVWACKYSDFQPPCDGKSSIVYAWANGAGPLEMNPEDAGVVVGNLTGITHLVLQAHFLPAQPQSSASVHMHITERMPTNFLSTVIFANNDFELPPDTEETDVETSCCMPGMPAVPTDLFAYRVHSHAFGKNISLSVDEEVIVHGDPQLPHIFNRPSDSDGASAIVAADDADNEGGDVEVFAELPMGSTWTVMCEYNTLGHNLTVPVGEGHLNEMCNMYLMLSSHVPRFGNCAWGYYFRSIVYALPGTSVAKVVKVIDDRGVMGQVAGIHLGFQGKHHLMLIFHRADRDMELYDHRDLIGDDVFMVYDTVKDEVVRTFGANMFKLPHGLTIDVHGNIWATDTDSQMVFKLDSSGERVLRTMGTDSERGWDTEHFCRPTEVAVSNSGEAFISDGYCNGRVMQYDKDGNFTSVLNMRGAIVPHSIVYSECQGLLYVADRENSLIRVISAVKDMTGFVRDGMAESFTFSVAEYGLVYSLTVDEYGDVFALLWDRNEDWMENPQGKVFLMHVQSTAMQLSMSKVQGWAVDHVVELPGVKYPHDFTVSFNLEERAYDVYVAETWPGKYGRITLFRIPSTIQE